MYAYAQESNLFLLVVEPFMSWLSDMISMKVKTKKTFVHFTAQKSVA